MGPQVKKVPNYLRQQILFNLQFPWALLVPILNHELKQLHHLDHHHRRHYQPKKYQDKSNDAINAKYNSDSTLVYISRMANRIITWDCISARNLCIFNSFRSACILVFKCSIIRVFFCHFTIVSQNWKINCSLLQEYGRTLQGNSQTPSPRKFSFTKNKNV